MEEFLGFQPGAVQPLIPRNEGPRDLAVSGRDVQEPFEEFGRALGLEIIREA